MDQLDAPEWLALALVVIGALNWGLYGLGGFAGSRIDLVALLLSWLPPVQNAVYVVVGLAGVFLAVQAAR